MNAKQAKIIEAIRVELNAAIATKDSANDAMDADRFYAACNRVRALEYEIHLAMQGKRPQVDSETAKLVAANID